MRHAQFRSDDATDEKTNRERTIFSGKLDQKTNEIVQLLQKYKVPNRFVVGLKEYFVNQGYWKYNFIESDLKRSNSHIRDFCKNQLKHPKLVLILCSILGLRISNTMGLPNETFEKMIYVNDPSKYIVHGYVRQYIIEPNDMAHLLIPPLVLVLCTAWFSYNTETFSHYSDQHMVVSGEDEIIETNKRMLTTAYGVKTFNHIKRKHIYSWTIRVLELKNKGTIYFGIDSSNKKYTLKDYSNPEINQYDFYALSSDGVILSKYKRETKVVSVESGFRAEDVVTIEIDAKRNKIRYIINMKEVFVSDRIDLRDNISANTDKYHMAIAMNGKCKLQIIACSSW